MSANPKQISKLHQSTYRLGQAKNQANAKVEKKKKEKKIAKKIDE